MPSRTIAAIATPPGAGGVALVRVSGGGASAIVRRLTDLKTLEPNTIKPCRFFRAGGREKLDRGLLAFFRAPHSYTGEDTAEFNCHGSPYLAQEILAEILQAGARLAAPGEFTKRAFLAGKLDLTQAEAVAEMLNAGSELQLKLALKHLDGDVAGAVRALRQDMLKTLAELEAALDYPEEIADPPPDKIAARLEAAQKTIDRLLADSKQGLCLQAGAVVVLAGRTNTGKSSLFNALLKYERAIVTELPGTTRDALEADLALNGARIKLVDTAGLRQTDDRLENLGIARSRAYLQSADLILFLLDAAAGITAEDKKILELIQNKNHLVVLNKADLPPAPNILDGLKISARTGAGLAELAKKILEKLGLQNIDLQQNIYIGSLRQQEKLWRAKTQLEKTASGLKTAEYLDLLAVGLKNIVLALGEITGEETSEEILAEIFQNFCVGK